MNKFLVMALMGLTAAAQTPSDPATRAEPAGASKAGSAKPVPAGSSLPSACTVGQMFFKTDAPAGANLFACTAANIWSVHGGTGGANCPVDSASQTLRCRDTSGNALAAARTAASGTAGAPGAPPAAPQVSIRYPVTERESPFDIPAFGICYAPGCGSEVSVNYYFISSPSGVTFDECGVSISTPPTGSSVIIDIQTPDGDSIFGPEKLVIPASVRGTVFQSNFASRPQTAAKGAQFKAVVLQNDAAGVAQFAYVKCRVH